MASVENAVWCLLDVRMVVAAKGKRELRISTKRDSSADHHGKVVFGRMQHAVSNAAFHALYQSTGCHTIMIGHRLILSKKRRDEMLLPSPETKDVQHDQVLREDRAYKVIKYRSEVSGRASCTKIEIKSYNLP